MKLVRILTPIALLLALTACGASTRSARIVQPVPPTIAVPDSAIMKECARPASLGKGSLTQERAEELWITDRSALLECYRRHLALRNYITDRDSSLRGDKAKDQS